MSPDAALEYLLGLPRFAGVADEAYKPGVERMDALMDAMDRPQEAFRSVHVAGTNGKGSVASMVAAIATAAGYRTGLHTSPHFVHVTERMRLDGVPAPDRWLAEAVTRYRPAFERVGPSFFEATVALSFRYFAERAADWAVVEVGLGGRLDATNVLYPALAVITNIDLEHTALLGDTHEAIAREKAGIVKPDTPVLVAPVPDEALAAIRATAEARAAPLHVLSDNVSWQARRQDVFGSVLDVTTPRRRYEALAVPLPGTHQQTNAVCALRAAELALPAVHDAAAPVVEGLQAVRPLAGLQGRGEVLRTDPLVVADVAHNPSGLAAALDMVGPAITERGGRLFVAFGGVRDKDVAAMARLLADAGATVFPVQFESPRAMPAADVASILAGAGVTVGEAGTVAAVLERFSAHAEPSDGLLITGSHAVVAAVPERRTASQSRSS